MKTINGHVLKQMIISGSNNLYNHYPEVDALNVFPVPDGDTGTNMNLTITSGAKEVVNLNNGNIYEIAKAFSRGLLMGARGNSGVILSQIFRGFAMAMEGKEKITVKNFAEAWDKGREITYKAVMRPVEGTILTVVRESATALKNEADKIQSIEEAMKFLIKEAKASLARTPELLPILKEVGVVDSGGAGFLYILEGFELGLRDKVVERIEISQQLTEQPIMAGANISAGDEEFGYCTEFLLRLTPDDSKKKAFIQKNFSDMIQKFGVSAVVVRDEEIVKVHVHTLKPGGVLNYAQSFGEFVKLKIENMQEQHNQLVEEQKPKNVEQKEYALVAVSVGKGIEKIYRDLRVDAIVSGGQTMNPSCEDFVNVIKNLNAKNVFILPNNGNIIMAASQACEVMKEENVNCIVIPSKTICQGLTACMMFNPDIDLEANIAEMKESLARVKSGSITFSVKKTKIDGVEIDENDFMGIADKKIVCAGKNRVAVTKELLESMIDDDTAIATLIYGEDVQEEEANELAAYLAKKYPIDVEVHRGDQPVYCYYLSIE